MTSNSTKTKGHNPADSDSGTVAFTDETITKARDIIAGYEAKELAAYVSSCRALALVVNKIPKGQRTDFKTAVADDGSCSVGTISAMLGVGQWVLTLTGLGVSVSEIQGLAITKSALQKSFRQKATDKVKKDDVPDVLTLDWLYEVGALVDFTTPKAIPGHLKREARPEGNDMDAPKEGTSAPMGGNQTPTGSEWAEFRRLAAKFGNMSGPYEKQTAKEREDLAYSLTRCLAQNKASEANAKANA